MSVQRPLVLSALLSLLLVACSKKEAAPEAAQMPPPQAVSVANVVQQDIQRWDEFNGRVVAVDAVDIRPRVNGVLVKTWFTEGQIVAQNAKLFSLDDREFRAAVRAASAGLANAKARAELNVLELARGEKLAAAKAFSREELDALRATAKTLRAEVQAAEAALEQAELNLSYTDIRAPIAGRIGAFEVNPGNLVSAGTTRLSHLVSLDPIYVEFSGDEAVYLRYQELARKGERESSRESRNPVRVGLSNETGYPHQGEMVFVDNVLDPNTGTIRARAVLKNPDGTFTPGLFARVQLVGSKTASALLIHDTAVMTDQDRRYVYVVGPGSVAQRKDVQLGVALDGLRVVESGLDPTDRVVVNGMAKIFFPGQPLAPREVPMLEPYQVAPEQATAATDKVPAAQPEGK